MRKNRKQICDDQKHLNESGNGFYAALMGEEEYSKIAAQHNNVPNFFRRDDTPTKTHSNKSSPFYETLKHSL